MKTLTWTTPEEARALVGKRVRMSEQGIKNWGDQSGGNIGEIVKVSQGDPVVDWGAPGSRWYRSGDLALAEPEAAPLPLDKIAVRVETESESKAVVGKCKEMGIEGFGGDRAVWGTNSPGIYFPGGINGRQGLCAWRDWNESALEKTLAGRRAIISTTQFLRDYPAPKPEAKPEPVKAVEPMFAPGPVEIHEETVFSCYKCGKETPDARRHAHDVTWDGEAAGEVHLCDFCYEALLHEIAKFIGVPFGARKQTRLEALRDLAASGLGPRPSEIAAKGYPRGGDR